MITVCVLKREGRLVGFKAYGHAEYAEEGYDIVCGAVSALTQTAVLGLKKRCAVFVATEQEGIYCVLDKECESAACDEAQIILDTMLLGLNDISESYKDYLSIIEREV